jgi:hypothetical protein
MRAKGRHYNGTRSWLLEQETPGGEQVVTITAQVLSMAAGILFTLPLVLSEV